MSRLGRDKQRDHERAERSPDLAATPIDVRVPEGDSGARSASVDGSLVVAAPGEEIQNAVLNRLHHLALAIGHPVLATIHDRRIGYSVPLQVDPDGSSHLAAEPVPTAPEEAPEEALEEAPDKAPEEASVWQDRATHVLRSVEPVRDSSPTFPLPAVPETRRAAREGDSAPTFTLRALPEPAEGTTPGGTAPGTVAPPTGAFGPPPVMDGAATTGAPEDAVPRPVPGPFTAPKPTTAPPEPTAAPPGPATAPEPLTAPEPVSAPEPTVAPEPVSAPEPPAAPEPVPAPKPVPARKPEAATKRQAAPASDLVRDLDPDPKPTPARGFDAVAEAVLGDEPITAPGDATVPALLAEPTARINEAVKEGRTEAAARLAEQTVTDASQTLGPEHPEVLRLRELTAYIAYLSGDPGRAFHLSLDLSRIHRRTGDAEAAYGNVQSAATAWRAVRDPARGLELGRDLVGLWDELAAEDGPAAEDAEQLDSARARMDRLAERVRAQAG